jgi:hypothetical protein
MKERFLNTKTNTCNDILFIPWHREGGNFHRTLIINAKQRHYPMIKTDSTNPFVADPRQQLSKTTILNRTYEEWHQFHYPQQQETQCGSRVCTMASIFATTNLTYQAGLDRLIGIENLSEKCGKHVIDVLQQQQWKIPTLI